MSRPQLLANMVLCSKHSDAAGAGVSPDNSRLEGVFEKEKKDKLCIMTLNLVTRGHSQVASEQSSWLATGGVGSSPARAAPAPQAEGQGLCGLGTRARTVSSSCEKREWKRHTEPFHLPSIGVAQRQEAEISWPIDPCEMLRRLRENRHFHCQ